MTHECEYEMDRWNKPTFSILYDILEVVILKISVLGKNTCVYHSNNKWRFYQTIDVLSKISVAIK